MSSEWSDQDIRKRLELGAGGTGRVSANVFFRDIVAPDQLSAAAQDAIEQAAKRLGRSVPDVSVGRVHRLAKSVSVEGDPALIAELSNADTVKTILPSEIDDIYPKPVRKTIVE
jgi:hypothetical protein